MARRKGLGRGLDALLGSGAVGERAPSEPRPDGVPDGDLRALPVDLVRQSRFQPRTRFDEEGLEELARSIRARGVVQPVVVRPCADGRHYELVAGERRWRAAQAAGLEAIPAVVRDVEDEAALAIALIENVQREDLNAVEEARALRRLVEEFGLTHQQVADAVGRSRVAVSNLMRLLELPGEVLEMIEDGRLEMGHGRALLPLERGRQRELAAAVAKRGLSVRQTEALVRRQLEAPARRATPSRQDPDLKRLETTMSEVLGAEVHIQHGRGGKGKIVIRYASAGELDGLLERLGYEG